LSKLREAVSKTHLKRLAQDVVEPTTEERRTIRRHRRRARVADEPVKLGSHLPANGNGGAQHATDEPDAIREARTRLRAMIAAATKDAPKPSVGIVLAIVNQETGNHAAANALIDEYGLERLFGIKKFCPNA
jgi:hypothetical protein